MSEDDKKMKRAQRFGLVSGWRASLARNAASSVRPAASVLLTHDLARFDAPCAHGAAPLAQPSPAQAPSEEDEEKKRQRRQRFGMVTKEDEKVGARLQTPLLAPATSACPLLLCCITHGIWEAAAARFRRLTALCCRPCPPPSQAALQASKAELLDPAKLKARAERFGAVKPTAGLSDEDKKKVSTASDEALLGMSRCGAWYGQRVLLRVKCGWQKEHTAPSYAICCHPSSAPPGARCTFQCRVVSCWQPCGGGQTLTQALACEPCRTQAMACPLFAEPAPPLGARALSSGPLPEAFPVQL